MKIAAVAFFCIILTGMAWPETVTVNAGLPQPPELSSSHVRIAIMLDGKPPSVPDSSGADLPGAKIRIRKNGPEGRAFVLGHSADAAGHFSAHLSHGPYLGSFYSEGFCVEARELRGDKGRIRGCAGWTAGWTRGHTNIGGDAFQVLSNLQLVLNA